MCYFCDKPINLENKLCVYDEPFEINTCDICFLEKSEEFGIDSIQCPCCKLIIIDDKNLKDSVMYCERFCLDKRDHVLYDCDLSKISNFKETVKIDCKNKYFDLHSNIKNIFSIKEDLSECKCKNCENFLLKCIDCHEKHIVSCSKCLFYNETENFPFILDRKSNEYKCKECYNKMIFKLSIFNLNENRICDNCGCNNLCFKHCCNKSISYVCLQCNQGYLNSICCSECI